MNDIVILLAGSKNLWIFHCFPNFAFWIN
jgi:hypothetical protein